MANGKIDKALQQLLAMGSKKVETELVWQNASPTSAFAAQTLRINGVMPNTPILVEHITRVNLSPSFSIKAEIILPKYSLGESAKNVMSYAGIIADSSNADRGVNATRSLITNDGSIQFENCGKTTVPSTGVSSIASNNSVVPYRIYILKNAG